MDISSNPPRPDPAESESCGDIAGIASPDYRDAKEVVRAIGSGEVDAIVVREPGNERVLALAEFGAVAELDDLARAIRSGEVDAFVMNEEGGERIHTLAVVEQALRESEAAHRAAVEQLRMALAAAGAGAWERRPGNPEPSWSPQYCELFGFAPGETPGAGAWRSRVHHDDLDRVLARLAAVDTSGSDSWSEEYRIVHPVKGVRWLASRGHVTRDTEGRMTIMRGITQDITDRKLMEEELAERRRNLEDQVRERTAELTAAHERLLLADRMAAVGTLAAGLAHDISNITLPLSIRIDTLLLDSTLPRKSKGELAVVTALLDHLRQMSNNLSLFSRDPLQEGTEGQTHLARWCERVKALLEASISAGGAGAPRSGRWIRFKCDVPQGLPPVAVAPHRLTQAVLNLVQNAQDAIQLARVQNETSSRWPSERGTITMQARVTEDAAAVVLQVVDDGCGMDAETKLRCTDLFFTTKDRPQAPGGGGSGMGVSLAYAIAVRVGGHMEVESEPGMGTTVKLILPVVGRANTVKKDV